MKRDKHLQLFFQKSDWPTFFRYCNDLVKNPTAKNVSILTKLLYLDYYLIEKDIWVPYVTRLLMTLGERGFSIIEKVIKDDSIDSNPEKMLEVIYSTSKGLLPDLPVKDNNVDYIHKLELTEDIIHLANDTFINIVIDSLTNIDTLFNLGFFIWMHTTKTAFDNKHDASVLEIISKSVVKLNERIIRDFERLIIKGESEEIYQQYLENNPCLVDPMAFEIRSKAKMGIEYTTDFVIRRMNNEYLLVEIEKPTDKIFTKKNDFTAVFTHAMGQVLQFQNWVESNIAYAEKHFPFIVSPQGIVIIGMKNRFSKTQVEQLTRFNINSRGKLKVLTYDDLIEQGKQLLQNLYSK